MAPINTITGSFGSGRMITSGDGYSENTNIGATFQSKLGKGRIITRTVDDEVFKVKRCDYSLTATYKYTKDYNHTQNINQRLYFPTKDYASREYSDTTKNSNQTERHSISASFQNERMNGFSMNVAMDWMDQQSRGFNSATNYTDGVMINRMRVNNNSNNRDMSLNLNMRGYIGQQITIDGKFGYNNSDMDGLRVDSLASSANKTYLVTSAPRDNYVIGADIVFLLKISKKKSIHTSYYVEYNDDKSIRLVSDEFTGLIDTTLTHNYTNRNITQQLRLSSSYDLSKNMRLDIRLDPSVVITDRKDRFPQDDRSDKVFFAPYLSLMLDYNRDEVLIRCDYSVRSQTPSLEMLLDKLDNINPFILSGGNHDIRSSQQHMFSFDFNKMNTKNQSSLSVRADFSLRTNEITTQQTYFSEDTYLSQYDYVAQKGAVLNNYVNVNGGFSTGINVRYNMYLSLLKSRMFVNGGMYYIETPTYINGQLTTLNSLRPSVVLGLNSNFSSKINYDISSTTRFDISENSDGNSDRRLNEQVSLTLRYNPHKRVFMNTAYEYMLVTSANEQVADLHNNIWNATVGFKFLKNRSGSVSASVYDILNRNKAFSSSMQTDYISNSWKRLFSRYFTVNMSFKINNKK